MWRACFAVFHWKPFKELAWSLNLQFSPINVGSISTSWLRKGFCPSPNLQALFLLVLNSLTTASDMDAFTKDLICEDIAWAVLFLILVQKNGLRTDSARCVLFALADANWDMFSLLEEEQAAELCELALSTITARLSSPTPLLDASLVLACVRIVNQLLPLNRFQAIHKKYHRFISPHLQSIQALLQSLDQKKKELPPDGAILLGKAMFLCMLAGSTQPQAPASTLPDHERFTQHLPRQHNLQLLQQQTQHITATQSIISLICVSPLSWFGLYLFLAPRFCVQDSVVLKHESSVITTNPSLVSALMLGIGMFDSPAENNQEGEWSRIAADVFLAASLDTQEHIRQFWLRNNVPTHFRGLPRDQIHSTITRTFNLLAPKGIHASASVVNEEAMFRVRLPSDPPPCPALALAWLVEPHACVLRAVSLAALGDQLHAVIAEELSAVCASVILARPAALTSVLTQWLTSSPLPKQNIQLRNVSRLLVLICCQLSRDSSSQHLLSQFSSLLLREVVLAHLVVVPANSPHHYPLMMAMHVLIQLASLGCSATGSRQHAHAVSRAIDFHALLPAALCVASVLNKRDSLTWDVVEIAVECVGALSVLAGEVTLPRPSACQPVPCVESDSNADSDSNVDLVSCDGARRWWGAVSCMTHVLTLDSRLDLLRMSLPLFPVAFATEASASLARQAISTAHTVAHTPQKMWMVVWMACRLSNVAEPTVAGVWGALSQQEQKDLSSSFIENTDDLLTSDVSAALACALVAMTSHETSAVLHIGVLTLCKLIVSSNFFPSEGGAGESKPITAATISAAAPPATPASKAPKNKKSQQSPSPFEVLACRLVLSALHHAASHQDFGVENSRGGVVAVVHPVAAFVGQWKTSKHVQSIIQRVKEELPQSVACVLPSNERGKA
eukprot:c9420_g1_i1.p1 GENE.c9420_g1_i1~~c9420_g1_i1.p1  ORF type:complete len:997 (-),score=226.08 c9420_g1_i1:134-2842(-)